MESLFAQLEFWHWLSFAMLLLVLEILSPGAFFLWLGIAAGSLALVLYIKPGLTWQNQIMIFALLSVASIVGWRIGRRFFPHQQVENHLNRRAEQYIGRTFTLIEPIVNGVGKIKVDDSSWRVRGVETAANTQVKVIAVDGVIFEVEPVLKN